jgi:hypothetical protein
MGRGLNEFIKCLFQQKGVRLDSSIGIKLINLKFSRQTCQLSGLICIYAIDLNQWIAVLTDVYTTKWVGLNRHICMVCIYIYICKRVVLYIYFFFYFEDMHCDITKQRIDMHCDITKQRIFIKTFLFTIIICSKSKAVPLPPCRCQGGEEI